VVSLVCFCVSYSLSSPCFPKHDELVCLTTRGIVVEGQGPGRLWGVMGVGVDVKERRGEVV